MCIYYVFRFVNTQPVSGVLSSQVTAISNSSFEYAILLTFKYSTEVSSLTHSASYTVFIFVYVLEH